MLHDSFMTKKHDFSAISATIFMGYILVFLVCHSPRLMLNIYELFTIRQAMECQTIGLDAFPLWPQVKSFRSYQSNNASCVTFHQIMNSR